LKMRSQLLCLTIALALLGYFVYMPIPDDIDEPWKLMVADSLLRSLNHLGNVAELLGLKHYMDIMWFFTFAEQAAVISDDKVKVTESMFHEVPVIVYEPMQKKNEELRRAIIYIHGGGWCLGSAKMAPYDLLSRRTAAELNAVVVSVEYRLAPEHHFPTPFNDAYHAVKHFLQEQVLAQYSVDATRIALSGDSAGGNMAAAVAQQIQEDRDIKLDLKAQALLYPVLQALDMQTPSYQQNEYMPILPKVMMIRFWSEYFTSDKTLYYAMLENRHNSLKSIQLMKFANWSIYLPENYRQKYTYSDPYFDSKDLSESISDPRASPLLVDDDKLRVLPKTYIVTCEYDVLRDDGVMYVTRLRRAGVQVHHDHYGKGFHGAMMFTMLPFSFKIAHEMTENYINWLNKNL
uniref:Arylacetamide deacetylase n=2 Tax=Erpetoichthys calabaricus TaxID=27687 RepID=A0A8C4S2I3_ERPCA